MDHGNKFKPRVVTPRERRELQALGWGRTRPFTNHPGFESKMVTTSGCPLCPQRFDYLKVPVAVCPRCGNCIFCGAYNADRYSNYCFTCGNGDPKQRTDAIYK